MPTKNSPDTRYVDKLCVSFCLDPIRYGGEQTKKVFGLVKVRSIG
jgi:hypothetical protein